MCTECNRTSSWFYTLCPYKCRMINNLCCWNSVAQEYIVRIMQLYKATHISLLVLQSGNTSCRRQNDCPATTITSVGYDQRQWTKTWSPVKNSILKSEAYHLFVPKTLENFSWCFLPTADNRLARTSDSLSFCAGVLSQSQCLQFAQLL